ncbi:uncharacterized protein F5Z01DRAFT_647092 [Emericellopsis atlantica]|uniref:Calcium-transporting ATPase n=1 Tax=Emericellopsis atlantica TaxID=2614577 RepID=A0A9P8CS81_9HYPO|nr:uncharacterized protein F5Z01DRAFT_647092 [Emericellopsis atlantica]KAG9257789.1 hypothetical protein F5Z01DRAFT_647092 [Emericellopsis atlantica]
MSQTPPRSDSGTTKRAPSPNAHPPQQSNKTTPELHIRTDLSRDSEADAGGSTGAEAEDDGSASRHLEVPSAHGSSRRGNRSSGQGSASPRSDGQSATSARHQQQPSETSGSSSGNGLAAIEADRIMSDHDALRPDRGAENAFFVQNNPFAFSPGQLAKMYDPKSLAAFYALGGLTGLEKGLRTNRKLGLDPGETLLRGNVTFEEATEAGTKTSYNANSAKAPVGGDAQPFEDRLRVYSDNRVPARQGQSFLSLVADAFKDKMIIMLCIAATISLGIGIYMTIMEKKEGGDKTPSRDDDREEKVEWIEGVAILVVVALCVLVQAVVDWRKEKRFAELNQKEQDRTVKVVRNGETVEISIHTLMAGDVVQLEPGDVIPADGVLIQGFNIKCDESQATGESDLLRKQSADEVFSAIERRSSLQKMDPFILSGAIVNEGVGTYLVTSTGVYSSYGKILMSLDVEQEMTPLQHKLGYIAQWIAKLGAFVAVALFLILMTRFFLKLRRTNTDIKADEAFKKAIDILLVVVVIVVVAIPEGLPLSVTLALAYAMMQMLKDNNLCRHLKSCEVMGSATTICSDKTGTLTQNKMTVVAGTVGISHQFEEHGDSDSPLERPKSVKDCLSEISQSIRDLLKDSIARNSTARETLDDDGNVRFVGSKTETALLMFAQEHLGMQRVSNEREAAKVLYLIPFDSRRKLMGTVVELPHGEGSRIYVKGASEIILDHCGQILREPREKLDTSLGPLSDDDVTEVHDRIDDYASRSLRTIGIAYRDFESWPPSGAKTTSDGDLDIDDLLQNLCFVSLVGIQDPLRPGVPEAIAKCQKAGVSVRMVTGDNKLTARAIASECGLLQKDGIVMEGPEFRNLTADQQKEVLPRLQVLSRSSPEDKRVLVIRLKEMGEVVAVTGDGTNDAPALINADVGFSMGKSGTDVAKQASAIVLLDDNFVSIVQALKWGRSVNDAVKKFLQFQLTVNLTALAVAFITAVASERQKSVLTSLQLLWVNMIMDTFAALALATDKPEDDILDRQPESRKAFIVTPTMGKMIVFQGIYQLCVALPAYFCDNFMDLQFGEGQKAAFVFNTFVWMQIFNQWNNRRLDNKFNIFAGAHRNFYLLGINAVMIIGQVAIMLLGKGILYQGEPQTLEMWSVTLAFGALSLPVGMVIRLIPDRWFMSLIGGLGRLLPTTVKERAKKSAGAQTTDEEIGTYPDALVEIHDELKFLRRWRGGRIRSLHAAIRHPREALRVAWSPATPPTPVLSGEEDETTGRRARSRTNPTLGAPTAMAGIVAAGIGMGWSPIEGSPRPLERKKSGGSQLASPRNGSPGASDRVGL